MNGQTRRYVARVLAVAMLAVPSLTFANLKDRGPVDPTTGYPFWYRDANGVALAFCNADIPSPNGGGSMCLPLAVNPAGFPGNWGDEAFYAVSDAILTAPGVSAGLTLALEGAYVVGPPIKGDEMVFARYRLRVDTTVAGDYTIVHPFGQKTYTGVGIGLKAINETIDIGAAAGLFDLALGGAPTSGWANGLGPFVEWDLLPGEPYTLTVTDPVSGAVQEYLGDPNILHTIKGSPFGTNYFQIIGPAGSNLDGLGGNVVTQPLFTVMGKKWMAPIALPLTIDRATFATDGITMNIDVFATANVGSSLLVSGAGFQAQPMVPDGTGKYYAHVVYQSNGAAPPATVQVTNLTDNPVSAVTAPVVDGVAVSASYDASLGTIDVSATSSDQRIVGGPALSSPSLGGAALNSVAGNPQLRSVALLTDVPPANVTVSSASGGSATVPTFVILSAATPGLNPVGVPDAVTTNEDTLVAIPVLANDTPTTGTLIVHDPAVNGQATVDAVNGVINYLPRLNWSGTDTFTYLIQDPGTGLLSNVTTVTVTVLPVNDAPVLAADLTSAVAAVAKVLSPLVNDLDPDGTINPATIAVVVAPAVGTAVANANGTITYTAPAGFAGSVSIGYTVADDLGAVSAVGTISVTVTAAGEQLTIVRAQWEIAKRRFRVDGSSSIFGPTIANKVTIYNGPNATYPVLAANVPIDALGAFTWDSGGAPVASPDATRRVTLVSTGGGQITATVVFK